MRFVGTIDAKVDQKGRVFLPAQFRHVFQDSESEHLIMRKDIFENCLVIFPERVWNQRLDELHERLSVWNRTQQQLFRQFVTDAECFSLDSNGRFLIPKRYLRMVDIAQEVTFIGMDCTIEIWSKNIRTSDDAIAADFGSALQEIME